MATDIDLGVFSVGDTDRFRFQLKKDKVPWDLTAATVTFTFNRPENEGGGSFDRVATIESPKTDGWVHYDSTVNDLDVDGNWTLDVLVEDGAVIKNYPYEIGFEVIAH